MKAENRARDWLGGCEACGHQGQFLLTLVPKGSILVTDGFDLDCDRYIGSWMVTLVGASAHEWMELASLMALDVMPRARTVLFCDLACFRVWHRTELARIISPYPPDCSADSKI